MKTVSGQLDGSSLLAELFSKEPRTAQILQNVIDSVNQVARNAGVSPTGDVQSPKSPDSVKVKVSGEMMHISIAHSGPVERGIRYFSEISPNDAAFGQPIVIDHGSSRTAHPITLPTKDDDGHSVLYHVRSYVQPPGGPPSSPTYAGAFTMAGATNMTLLPSQGSGTAPNSGQSAGQGLGKNQRRL